MIEFQKKLYELLTPENFSFGDDYIEFVYTERTNSILNKELDLSPEPLNHSGKKFIRIYKKDLPFLIFENNNEFQKISIIEKLIKEDKDILILSDDKQRTISWIKQEPYIDFNKKKEYYYFKNIFSYVNFINFLKSLDNENENAFHFIDYFNKDHKKIVLTSLSEKSRIIIKYKNEIPTFTVKKDLSEKLYEFKQCFKDRNNQIVKFLKNSFIEYASRYDFENRLPELFNNLDKILETAHLNFEVYINNLSIDKVKEDYYNYKTKYFKNISDILSKLTQKIIGLPIAFATTLFIINKLTQTKTSDNSLFLCVLIIILSISMVFIVFLLKIHYKDLLSIHSSFSREYKALMNNNFFNKYPDEKEDFEELNNNINTKIKILKSITIGYYWLLTLSNLFLFYFITNKIGVNVKEWDLLIQLTILIVIIILLVLGNLLIVNKKKMKKSVA